MKIRSAIPVSFLLVITSMSWCHFAHGEDWPRWRGPGNDGYVPAGVPVPLSLASEPAVVWHVPVGDGLASPVVSEGRVFHLDARDGRETVHAVSAEDGKTLWTQDLDATFRDGQSNPGPRCSPVIDGNRIYVQSCRGEFRSLNVADGRTVWRVNFEADFQAVFVGEKGNTPGASRHGYTGAPLVRGNDIFVTVGGTNAASVVCFDKLNGAVKWRSQNDMAGYAAPVYARPAGVEQLIVFTAEALISLRPGNGELLWRIPIKTSYGRHVTTPIVVDDVVVVSTHQAGMLGIRVSKGDADSCSAEQAWVNKPAGINYASPVAVGSYVYGLDRSHGLVCVDARTGEGLWSQQDFTDTRVVKDYLAMLVMGENILMLVDNGELVMFKADPTAYREIGRSHACGRTWAHPAYADGRLYLRDEAALICLDLLR